MFVKLQLVELRLSPFKLRLCPPRGLCFCFLALLYSLVAAQIACSYCTRDSSPRLNFFLASENASSQPVNLDFHDVLLRKNTFEPAFSPTRSLYNSSFNLNSRNSRLQSNDAEMLIQSLCSWKILIGTFDTAIRKENGSGTSCPFDNSTAATQLFFFSLWCSFSKIEEKVNGNTVVQWSERESPMIATLGPCNLISMKIKDEEAGIFGCSLWIAMRNVWQRRDSNSVRRTSLNGAKCDWRRPILTPVLEQVMRKSLGPRLWEHILQS
eukprot:TRINITY_DN132_c0_g2_i5.p1 TRINITY_DN132_c0_g2~~TRINITY_DN132_c0_g2_i5.p1  ORF type:complete len:267 (-),score=18.99 TRINITY_DN132_c0_g2_i5:192-992(-)